MQLMFFVNVNCDITLIIHRRTHYGEINIRHCLLITFFINK